MSVVHLNKEQFNARITGTDAAEWKYVGDKPALVDFFATWCSPCKALSPILEEIAAEYEDKIYVYKVDVDEEHDLAQAFDIQSVPTLLFIPTVGMPQLRSGMLSKAELKAMIETILFRDCAVADKA